MTAIVREYKRHPLRLFMIIALVALLITGVIAGSVYAATNDVVDDPNATTNSTVSSGEGGSIEGQPTETETTETTETTEASNVLAGQSLGLTLSGGGRDDPPPPPQVTGVLTVTVTFVNAPTGKDNPTSYTASVKQNGSQAFNASGNAVFPSLDLGKDGSKEFEVTGVSPDNGATVSYPNGNKKTLTTSNPNGTIAVTMTWPAPTDGDHAWNRENGKGNNCPYGGQLYWVLTAGGGGFSFVPAETTLEVKFADGATKTFNGFFEGGGSNGAIKFISDSMDADGTNHGKVVDATAHWGGLGEPGHMVLTISHSIKCYTAPQLYDLRVHKDFATGFPQALQDPTRYRVRAVCAANSYDEWRTFDASGNAVFEDLKPGQYALTEESLDGVPFTYAFTPASPVTIGSAGLTVACVEPGNDVVNVTVVNTYVPRLGQITLCKNLAAGDWPAGVTAADFTAVYKYDGVIHKVPFELVDEANPLLGRAILQIPEEYFGLYEFIGEEGPNGVDYNVVINPGSVTVDAQNLTHEVTYTNTYKPPVTTTEPPVTTTEPPVTTTTEAPATTTTLGPTTTTLPGGTTTTTIHKGDRDEYPFTGFQLLIGLGAAAALGGGGVALRRLTSRKK